MMKKMSHMNVNHMTAGNSIHQQSLVFLLELDHKTAKKALVIAKWQEDLSIPGEQHLV